MKILIVWGIVALETWLAFGFVRMVLSVLTAARDVAGAVLFRGRRTTPAERAARKSACLPCPMFDPAHRTCGSPGMVDDKGEKFGCWCPVDASSFVKSKTCYRTKDGEGQWKA